MVNDLPGLRPIGATIPTMVVMVNPLPSGERLVFSRVIPSVISVLNWLSAISLPSTFTVKVDNSGAENKPGTSSVNRATLTLDEPLLVKVKRAVTFCGRYERRLEVE